MNLTAVLPNNNSTCYLVIYLLFYLLFYTLLVIIAVFLLTTLCMNGLTVTLELYLNHDELVEIGAPFNFFCRFFGA